MHFKVNLWRVHYLSADWRSCPHTGERQQHKKGAKKSVIETLMKCNLDIVIKYILNYFCCDLKVCMQFLSYDGYQLNSTVRGLEL